MRFTIDGEGWLRGDGVIHVPTVRTTRLSIPVPAFAVWHFTRTPPTFNPRLMAKNISTYEKGADVPKSWHLLLPRDGGVIQSAPFLVGTWHCGKPASVGGRRYRNINRASVGIELENAGELRCGADGYYAWPFHRRAHGGVKALDPRLRIPDGNVEVIDGAAWECFTKAQLEVAEDVAAALMFHYGMDAEDFMHGHSDFDPERKVDPGPVFKKTIAGLARRASDEAYAGRRRST